MSETYIGNFCKVCNKLIIIKRPRDRFKTFCGRKCVAIFYKSSDVIYKTCNICNCDFEFAKGQREKYCSTVCHAESRKSKYEKKCEYCNNSFILRNKAYERRGSGRFCSQSCATRKFSVNENYFKKIDTEQKAYWLGFIYADGHNSGYELIINLQNSDAAHLYEFRKQINSEHPIKPRSDGRTTNYRVNSLKMCTDLDNIGCKIGSKFSTIRMPTLSQELYRHFIRGFFDGDGHISKTKSRVASIYSSSTSFIVDLRKELNKNNIQTKGNAVNIGIYNIETIVKLFHYLYDDSTVYLDRKFIRFVNYSKEYKLNNL